MCVGEGFLVCVLGFFLSMCVGEVFLCMSLVISI